jgi:hypothetical protein
MKGEQKPTLQLTHEEMIAIHSHLHLTLPPSRTDQGQ